MWHLTYFENHFVPANSKALFGHRNHLGKIEIALSDVNARAATARVHTAIPKGERGPAVFVMDDR
jgi:hypothetical protein